MWRYHGRLQQYRHQCCHQHGHGDRGEMQRFRQRPDAEIYSFVFVGHGRYSALRMGKSADAYRELEKIKRTNAERQRNPYSSTYICPLLKAIALAAVFISVASYPLICSVCENKLPPPT